MVIIVEGIDRVGKTTLCEKLKTELNASILKGVSYHDFTDLQNKHKAFGEVLVNTSVLLENYPKDRHIIVDRFHLSHFVYGYVERHALDNSSNVAEEHLLNTNTILVLVQPTDLRWSIAKHGADLTVHNTLFNLLVNYTRLPCLITNYNEFDKCINSIKELVNIYDDKS